MKAHKTLYVAHLITMTIYLGDWTPDNTKGFPQFREIIHSKFTVIHRKRWKARQGKCPDGTKETVKR
jgi:hypothetical protein